MYRSRSSPDIDPLPFTKKRFLYLKQLGTAKSITPFKKIGIINNIIHCFCSKCNKNLCALTYKTEILVSQNNIYKRKNSHASYNFLSVFATTLMYVTKKGITESVTHDELIAKRGDYYKLYTAQAV